MYVCIYIYLYISCSIATGCGRTLKGALCAYVIRLRVSDDPINTATIPFYTEPLSPIP